mmetsp:Transcript_32175/g.58192  ORF Transcript_32175/g.58192 Transcript_32175/m.58192 type:complete len:404 (-) Transcript_32175:197-1408(-)
MTYSKRLRTSRSMPLMPSAVNNQSSDDSDIELCSQESPLSSISGGDSPIRRRAAADAAARYSYRASIQKEPRKVKRTFMCVISLFASCWAIFMCFILWQFHIGNVAPTVDPIAFSLEERRFIPLPPRVTIPLPLPPNKISVLLINYSRPRMVRDSSLMRTLLAHPNVDEVLLLHANPKTAFEFVHPKVVNIDATRQNDEIGLSLRFYFCQLAKHDWILHVDDDMQFPTSTLNELLIEYSRNPKRIVGRFGRDLKLGNSFNGYSSSNSHKSTEVILTKLMAMEKSTCSAFFDYSHLIWDDVVLTSGEGPLWNGEDIFMSLVANHVYGQGDSNNFAMDWLDVWQASDSLKDYDNGKLDISGGMKGYRLWDWQWWQSVLRRNRHYSYRGQLWQTAKQRLFELGDRQ